MNAVPFGELIPDGPHAISVHIPTWKSMCSPGLEESKFMGSPKNGYPRVFVHERIQKLLRFCQETFIPQDHRILLFLDPKDAQACKSYISSCDIHGPEVLPQTSLSLCNIDFGRRFRLCHDRLTRPPALWGIVYPQEGAQLAFMFWRITGTGISSRLAERCLQHTDWMQLGEFRDPRLSLCLSPECSHPVYATIRNRIATLLERAPAGPLRAARIYNSDVFLYPSGTSAIYHVHEMLIRCRGGESVGIGFPCVPMPVIPATHGDSSRIYGLGTDQEIDELDERLRRGTRIRAVWCECPSNPLLWTTDLERIRKLADTYGFVVVVDDTIGSFANVDVLDVADIVVTSLSQAFNGDADILAGIAIPNPNSPHYRDLRTCMKKLYTNSLYVDDAVQLEINSRDFLTRAAQLNQTAEYLVEYVHAFASRPGSVVDAVYYPKVCSTTTRYRSRMRRCTEEFTPGYGALFSMEFYTVVIAKAFFDNLEVTKCPSLGDNLTLAQPYVQTRYSEQKEWAAKQVLKDTIVRISVGLEDKEILLGRVKHALEAVQQAKA